MISKLLPGTPIQWGHPLANGLVACWPFWERSGSKVYNVINGRASSAMTSIGFRGGRMGGPSANFGASSRIPILVTLPALPAAMDKTVAFWVNPRASSNSNRYLLQSTLDMGLQLTGSGGNIAFNDGAMKSTGVAAVLNVWQSLMFSFNGSIARVYLNGVQIGGDIVYTPSAIGTSAALGSTSGTLNSLDGLMELPCVWARGLTPVEAWLYHVDSYAMFAEAAGCGR